MERAAIFDDEPEEDIVNDSFEEDDENAPRPLSIGRSEQGALGSISTLAIIEERVARSLIPQFETILQTGITIKAQETQIIKWSEAESLLEDPGCYALLEVEAMGGHAIISIEHHLFFSMLEKVFGYKQTASAAEPRSRLSSIESRVLKRMVRIFALSMEQAWKPILPIHMNTLRVDTRPASVALTSAEEAVIFETYDFQMEDEIMGQVHVIIPKVIIWRFKELLASGRYDVSVEPEKESRTKIENSLRQVQLELTAELGRTHLKLEQLAVLAEGDVLRLDRSPDMPTIVQVNGQPKFLAKTTVKHGNLAVELDAAIFSTSDQEH